MKNTNNLFEFKADFIIAGTMYVNNKKEITYKQIEIFRKNLNNEITANGDRCLFLFSNVYLKELEQDPDSPFYIGENFIALKKNLSLNYLNEHIFAYQSLDTIKTIFKIKDKTKIKNKSIEN